MIIDIIRLGLLITLLFYSSYTDFKKNIIENTKLTIYALAGAILLVVNFILHPSVMGLFFLNEIIIIILSIGLYAGGIWAAGDSKLMIVVGLLIPDYFLITPDHLNYSFMIPIYAFAISFVYLLIDTGICIVRSKGIVNIKRIKGKITASWKGLIINCIYIMLIIKLQQFFLEKYGVSLGLIQLLINICLLAVIASIPVLRKMFVVIPVLFFSLAFSAVSGIWLFSWTRLMYYFVVAGFMVVQVLIGEYNYRAIPANQVERGMVLSTISSMMMSVSPMEGLPGISNESLKSRLSEDEAAAVRKWGMTKNGVTDVLVVKKIPFAIFISAGTLLFLLGRVVIW